MNTPHPPISDGTSGEEKLRAEIHRRAGNVFAKVPSEAKTDSMAIVYRPNNLRRQTTFSLYADSGVVVDIGAIRSRFGASAKGLVFRKRGRVLLQLGRRKLTAIFDQRVGGRKEAFRFVGSASQIEEGIVSKVEEIRVLLDDSLSVFCRELGLVLAPPVIWERVEEGLGGIDYLDSLPRDLIIHDIIFQKVYDGEGEFLTRKGGEPSRMVIHTIRNRALNDFAPGIERELSRLNDIVEARVDPVAAVIGRLRSVMRGGGLWYLAIVEHPISDILVGLDLSDKLRLSEELFTLSAEGRCFDGSS